MSNGTACPAGDEHSDDSPRRGEDVVSWLAKLHHTDESHAEQIWNEYFPRLAKIARQKLGSLPLRSFDEEDVACSALDSFFRGVKKQNFQLKDKDDLWRLLVTITVRKAHAQRRRFFADRRGKGRVRGDSVFCKPGFEDSAPGFEVVLDDCNMPELAEDVVQACEDLLGHLNRDQLRQAALMKMEGYTHAEVAEELKISVSRVKQLISEIKRIWQDRADLTQFSGDLRTFGQSSNEEDSASDSNEDESQDQSEDDSNNE